MTQTSMDDPVDLRVSTVGQGFADIQGRIVDPATNRELAPGEQGEVVCPGL
jgi:fatty-acyl-CoA synthase